MRSQLPWLLGLALLAACASPTPMTDGLDPATTPLSSRVDGVPYIKQEVQHCGPASLAMVMAHAGRPRSAADLALKMMTPGQKGTFQTDLLSASRREGMMAVPLHGLPRLLTELHGGRPVIVLHNLGPEWWPRWHYEVVWGHDLKTKTVRVHSGPKEDLHVAMKVFERRWEGSQHWGLVVFPPEALAASGNELEHATAAAGLELAGQTVAARTAYSTMLTRWPTSLPAGVGLGNTHFTLRDYASAARALRQVAQHHPDSPVVWHNLTIAEGKSGDKRAARQAAAMAIRLAGGTGEEGRYQASLADWL